MNEEARVASGIRRPRRRFLRGLAAGASLAGTVRAAADPASRQPIRIAERYEVGNTVYVRSLAIERARDALWIGTSSGVNEIDLRNGERRSTFTRNDGLASEYVFAIGIDSAGDKWFGTNAGGVSRYRDGRWKTYFPMHGLADYWVYAFANDREGNLWIGTWAGASHFDLKTSRFRTYKRELVNEWVYGLGVDPQGKVWFGTEGGVSMFDGRRWQAWTHRDGLGEPNRRGLAPSPNTGLGTRSRHDLSVLSAGAASYNPNYVFAIQVALDGSIWAGTWGGGVSRFDGRRWHNLTTANGLAGDIVYSIAQGADGALWFGTDAGVSRYRDGRFDNLTPAEGLFDRHVYALAVAPAGDVWVGTRRGVVRVVQDAGGDASAAAVRR